MDQIIPTLTSTPTLVVAGVMGVLLLLFLMIRSSGKKSTESDFLGRVRELVEQGDFRGAASLQRNHGNHKEAFNLFERGRHFMEAAKIAESQGWYDKSARLALQAGQFEWAAELHIKAKNPEEAAELFARAGQHARAAELLEQLGSHEWAMIAQCWEKALLKMLPSDQNIAQLSPDAIRKVYQMAEKAAAAYQKAGNPNRAALIYEACQQTDKAQTIRRTSGGFGGLGSSMSGMGSTALGGPTGMQQGGFGGLGMGGNDGLNDQSLTLLSKVVDQAVQKAIDKQPAQPTTTQVIVGNQKLTNAQLEGAGTQFGNSSQIQVIYIPDMGSNKTTAVRAQNDRYEIREKLGEGGMAVVYKAIDKVLEREVAMKFLPEGVTQAATSYDLFEREAKSAAAINHPNIITIYDFGQLENRPFICMELLDGISMDTLIQKMPNNRLPLNAFFEIFDELLSALETAHGRGLVHRDVKPSNMMLTRQKLLKLMDFGIAKEIDPEKSTMIAGTPYYMAPEQFSGKGIDHRVDIFAVGVTMYLCLTGKLPFEGFMRIEPPRPPSELCRIPDALNKVVMWCLAFEPNKRPQSAFDLLQNLRRVHRELKRDRLFAKQLQPEGQDAFIPLLGHDFFQEESAHLHSMRQRSVGSPATIASFQSSADLPAASRSNLPSAGQYSRPMIGGARRSSHSQATAATHIAPSQSGPIRSQAAFDATQASMGFRPPSHPNIPRIRNNAHSVSADQRSPMHSSSSMPSAQHYPAEDMGDQTMLTHPPQMHQQPSQHADPRRTNVRNPNQRNPRNMEELLSHYIDKK